MDIFEDMSALEGHSTVGVCVWVTVFTQVPELILFIYFFFSMLMYWR